MHPLLEDNREKIAALCRQYGVKRLDVFGSILRDDFDPATSDVDVVAEFDLAWNGSALRQYFDFKSELESALGRPVDIIERRVRNPYVDSAIQRSRVPFYAP